MLRIINEPFMLSVIMLNVVMLSVGMLIKLYFYNTQKQKREGETKNRRERKRSRNIIKSPELSINVFENRIIMRKCGTPFPNEK